MQEVDSSGKKLISEDELSKLIADGHYQKVWGFDELDPYVDQSALHLARAEMYYRGYGCSVDLSMAKIEAEKAAAAGSIPAMFSLARMVPPSSVKATRSHRRLVLKYLKLSSSEKNELRTYGAFSLYELARSYLLRGNTLQFTNRVKFCLIRSRKLGYLPAESLLQGLMIRGQLGVGSRLVAIPRAIFSLSYILFYGLRYASMENLETNWHFGEHRIRKALGLSLPANYRG